MGSVSTVHAEAMHGHTESNSYPCSVVSSVLVSQAEERMQGEVRGCMMMFVKAPRAALSSPQGWNTMAVHGGQACDNHCGYRHTAVQVNVSMCACLTKPPSRAVSSTRV